VVLTILCGGGDNGVLATFHFLVRKSITAPPRGPPGTAGICIYW